MNKEFKTDEILNYIPRWPLIVQLASSVICLGLSATYHLFHCMGKHADDQLALFDYGGISILIMGSTYPPIFYSFACQPVYQVRDIFMVLITVSCLLAFGSLFNKTLAYSHKFRHFRGLLFAILGCSAITPLVYLNNLTDKANITPFSIVPFCLGGVVYFTGVVFYIFAIPERFSVKTFDIIGGSHQIFHVCVLGGAAILFNASMNLFLERQKFTCPMEM